MRTDKRPADQLRDTKLTPHYLEHAEGSVLIEAGRDACHLRRQRRGPRASVSAQQRQRAGSPPSTACCRARPPRARSARRRAGKVGGRTQEIQRLIGRSLRSVTKLSALGERTIWIDCDVIQADGGTRTALDHRAFVALALALGDAARSATS